MTEKTQDVIDWTDDSQVAKAMLGIEIPPEPQPEEVKAEPETTATAETSETTTEEQPRDSNGKFMPLDAHKRVLENERHRREQIESENAALQAQLAAMQEQMKPKQSDKDFESAIEDLPEHVANVMRAERAARLEIEQQLAAEKSARQAAIQQAEQAEQQRTHESLLATVPIVKEAYEDPIKRAAVDAISNSLMAQAGGQIADLAAHYKAVEAEYVKRFNATPKSRELPGRREPAVPPSLSSIPGSAPAPSGSPLEEVESLGAMGSAARFSSMSEAQLNKFLAGL